MALDNQMRTVLQKITWCIIPFVFMLYIVTYRKCALIL